MLSEQDAVLAARGDAVCILLLGIMSVGVAR